MHAKDQLGRVVKVPAHASRIVSLVPSQTELLVDLGLEDRLVGVTKFCIYPENLRLTKTVIGGTKKVHLDKIKALRPDLIVANKEENTRQMVQQLEKIAPVWVSDILCYDQALDMIRRLGTLLSVADRAGLLCREIDRAKVEYTSNQNARIKVRVAYLIWNNPLMAAGTQTFIDNMLSLAGFKNVVKAERYPEVNDKVLTSADLLLLSSEPFPFKETHRKELENRLGRKCLLVDGSYFSWYGSRMGRAFAYFKGLRDQLA